MCFKILFKVVKMGKSAVFILILPSDELHRHQSDRPGRWWSHSHALRSQPRPLEGAQLAAAARGRDRHRQLGRDPAPRRCRERRTGGELKFNTLIVNSKVMSLSKWEWRQFLGEGWLSASFLSKHYWNNSCSCCDSWCSLSHGRIYSHLLWMSGFWFSPPP